MRGIRRRLHRRKFGHWPRWAWWYSTDGGWRQCAVCNPEFVRLYCQDEEQE